MGVDAWQPKHISDCLHAVRKWCNRQNVTFKYVWVAELQRRGALHYHLAIWLPGCSCRSSNREKALFSHIFNKAREWGYTASQNPCQGVKGFKERGRDRYVTDEEFANVRELAHPTVQDAMDVALLTGQRPADVLKIQCRDIRDGALWVTQNKTGTRIGIEITGELQTVIARISDRPRRAISPFLIQEENGQPLTLTVLRNRFEKAKRLAGVDFQFQDIRAKAASDTGDLAHPQKLLAHKNRDMTEHYVRSRVGDRVKPLR